MANATRTQVYLNGSEIPVPALLATPRSCVKAVVEALKADTDVTSLTVCYTDGKSPFRVLYEGERTGLSKTWQDWHSAV